MALVEIEKLSVSYGGLQALDGATCSFDRGAIGLLGPNGAGKSTLIRTLMGFNKPTSGRVEVFGRSLPKAALEVRRRLGYMPEFEVVRPRVSSVAFVAFCAQLFGMAPVDARERAHQVLNYVGLGENRYRTMETYSTGMLQRVKLAQALVHDPELLLLDEPTNGLDPDGRVEMLQLIADIAESRNVTVILSSHLLPDVQQVCRRVVILNRGKVVRDGALDALMPEHESRFDVRVHARRDAFQQALDAAGYSWSVLDNGGFRVDAGTSGAAELFRLALACGAHVRHLAPARTRLEEEFLQALTQDGPSREDV